MKRHILILLMLALLWSLLPVHAQDNSDQRIEWAPYEFSVTLPEGWTSHMTSERLLLGTQEDIDAVQATRLPDGVIVEIEVVEPALGNEAFLFTDFVFLPEAPLETRHYGSSEWTTMDIPTVGSRRGKMVLVAQTFRLTVTGPSASWDTDETIIDTLIASIDATPVQRAAPDRLTQNIAWRNLRLRAPNHLNPYQIQAENVLLIVNFDSRLMLSRTFEFNILYVTVYDLSSARHVLTLTDALQLDPAMNRAMAVDTSKIEAYELAGYPAARVEYIMYGDDPGMAVAVKTSTSMYLIFGQAGAEEWETTERDLFEAMLATVEIRE